MKRLILWKVLPGLCIMLAVGICSQSIYAGEPENTAKKPIDLDYRSLRFKSGEFGERMQKRREQIRMLKVYRLIEFLDLNEDMSTRFLPLFHQYEKRQAEIREKQLKLGHELLEALQQENSSETKLKKMYREYLDLETSTQKSRDDFRKKAEKILTTKQMIKLGIFGHYFRGQLKEMLLDRRESGPRER